MQTRNVLDCLKGWKYRKYVTKQFKTSHFAVPTKVIFDFIPILGHVVKGPGLLVLILNLRLPVRPISFPRLL